MQKISEINALVNNIVWGKYTLIMLLGVGIFFTLKLRFFPVVQFGTWWKNTAMSFLKSRESSTSEKISPFRAVATALAGSIGTGNIVGVANAIALGGAGAIFWMWTAAFFGMSTVFAENVLGMKYRIKRNGKYVGGAMYYIERGMKCKWLAVMFAVFCTLSAFGMGNMTQANSVSGALENFGISPKISGIILAVLVGVIIFGGIDRISGLTEKLVPFMAVIYTIAVLIVIGVNFREIPNAFKEIFEQAFDLKSVAGGFMGYGMSRAVKYGISRGVFSNEAGLGSSPIVHSAADSDEPYKQGMYCAY